MIFTAPPQPPRTLDQNFEAFLFELRRHVTAYLGQRVPAPLAAVLVALICGRLGRIGYLFAKIAKRVREGRVRGSRQRVHLARPSPAPDAPVPLTQRLPRVSPQRGLPRRKGWLLALVPLVGNFAGQLAHFLANPQMRPLLSAPGMTDVLRPLCRMLGVADPELFRREHEAAHAAHAAASGAHAETSAAAAPVATAPHPATLSPLLQTQRGPQRPHWRGAMFREAGYSKTA